MSAELDRFLSPDDRKRIVAAIAEAEARTSGEIKVHVEPRVPKKADPYARATEVFAALGLHKTTEHNAVLLYVASEDRRFALIGDTAIHADVGDAFWTNAVDALKAHFGKSAYADGIVAAVKAVGDRLAARFPRKSDAPKENQLSDEISTEETLKKPR